jgi:hypothetical protein
MQLTFGMWNPSSFQFVLSHTMARKSMHSPDSIPGFLTRTKSNDIVRCKAEVQITVFNWLTEQGPWFRGLTKGASGAKIRKKKGTLEWILDELKDPCRPTGRYLYCTVIIFTDVPVQIGLPIAILEFDSSWNSDQLVYGCNSADKPIHPPNREPYIRSKKCRGNSITGALTGIRAVIPQMHQIIDDIIVRIRTYHRTAPPGCATASELPDLRKNLVQSWGICNMKDGVGVLTIPSCPRKCHHLS